MPRMSSNTVLVYELLLHGRSVADTERALHGGRWLGLGGGNEELNWWSEFEAEKGREAHVRMINTDTTPTSDNSG